MTMAKVENGEVTQVGLPADMQGMTDTEIENKGWLVVAGDPMPTERPPLGYRWVYGESYRVEGNRVYGEWQQEKKPQPYPSWSWVEGEGWVPPTPKPDGDYTWEEESQQWTENDLV